MKRGQVTVYIIVGLIALVAVGLALYVNQEYIRSLFEQQTSKLTGTPQAIQPVEDHIKFCLEDTAKLSSRIVLLQGGYFEPKSSVEMGSYNIAYWYDKKDISPNLETIGKETSISMGYLLPGCIYDFNEDYEIKIKSIIPSVTINNEKIIASAKTDIEVTYKNLTSSLNKNYIISFDSEAKKLYDASIPIVKAEEVDPDNVHLTLLASTGYDVNFFRLNESMVYSLTGDELTLMFANKF